MTNFEFLKDDLEYERALRRLEEITEGRTNVKYSDYDDYDKLIVQIEQYEQSHFNDDISLFTVE